MIKKNKLIATTCLGALLLCAITNANPARVTINDVEQGFKNPPESAKPMTWWHWLDGNVTKEGITADLESMKRIGLGGAIMFNGNALMFESHSKIMPKGPARFMGEKWLSLVDHAMKESSRLGLEFGVHNCDGFSQSGGPWITPEMSMKKLVWTAENVEGSQHFKGKLPKPKALRNFYKDVAVIAFPLPEGEILLTGPGTDTVLTGPLPSSELAKLTDGNLKTAVHFPKSRQKAVVKFEFSEPRTVRSVKSSSNVGKITMEASTDGKNYQKVGSFDTAWIFKGGKEVTGACDKEVDGKFFRLSFNSGRSLSEIELSETARIHYAEGKSGRLRKGGHGGARELYGAFPELELERKLASSFTIPRDEVKNISANMSGDGSIEWDVPDGKWRIMRIGYTTTGSMTVPSTEEGKGLECDKFDASALRFHFENYMDKLLALPGGQSLTFMQTESWHCNCQNWSAGLENRFQKNVGYDILEYMPTLLEGWIIENPNVSERVLWDWRRFLADQIAEQYYAEAHSFAQERGLTHVGENTSKLQFLYNVSALRHADVPMGEFWPLQDGVRVDNKAAASFAHITGKKVVASESYTSFPRVAWDVSPFTLKALGDEAFCAGVNKFIFHTFAHQPYEVTGPGFTFGKWGLHFNRANTWWDPGYAWMDYLTRCNYMLRAGLSVSDVLYYVGDDVPNYIGWRDELTPALPKGYDFDGCDAQAVMEARVEDGMIVLPAGTKYRVLLLPDSPNMTLSVLKKVKELVEAGAVVLGPRPTQSNSFTDIGKGDAALQEMAEELWGGAKPRIWSGVSFEELFKHIDLSPDFDIKGNANVLYIHRRMDDAEIYFVSNQEDRPLDLTTSFRAGNLAPELWDPATGEIRELPDFSVKGDVVELPLHLDAYGSAFLVFRGNRKPTAGKNHLEFKTVLNIRNPWTVNFPPNLGAPETATFKELSSWTEHSESGIRFFSGTATYQTGFEYNAPKSDKGIYLDLGKVAVMAEVELNGKNLGVLWKPPFRVRIDEALKTGKNTLEIKVTNLWRNRMIGDESLPEDDVEWPEFRADKKRTPENWPEWLLQGKPRPSGRVTFCTQKDVYSTDDALAESGLLGPVRIIERNYNR